MAQPADTDDLVRIRRELHRHPEPAWCEFYTTARIVEELRSRDVDEILYGPEVLGGERRNVPTEATLRTWMDRAAEAGARQEDLTEMDGGYTGAVGIIRRGDGPTVGLRVDIDGLPITESDSEEHRPAAVGFRSETEGHMHACGHDAHAAIGLGVIDAVLDSAFEGTLKVFFQPGEEQIVGGEPMANSGLVDDVDYLFALHVGLDHPTGEIVAGIDGFLAVSHFLAEFEGEAAHAGGHPEEGDNAVQAMATAVQNLYAIPRHHDGATRINAGLVGGGTATNIIPEGSHIEGEVRGETTALMEYMNEEAENVICRAAEMHGCEVDTERLGRAPSATSDSNLASIIAEAAAEVEGVESILERDELGGSEDATFLMERVQEQGGSATYVGIGTDHPGGHHTSRFDVDEASLEIGVETLSNAIVAVASAHPIPGP